MGQNVNYPNGNVMETMMSGANPAPNGSLTQGDIDAVYERWDPAAVLVGGKTLSEQGTLLTHVEYDTDKQIVPTAHFNGHAVCMTGDYILTGLNEGQPASPTLFEFYRKHSDPERSAINCWWLSEGLGAYPSLNYSKDPDYGAQYGANYFNSQTIFRGEGLNYLGNANSFSSDAVDRINGLRGFLDGSFDKTASDLPGIQNTEGNRERIRQFISDMINKGFNGIDLPIPNGTPINRVNSDLTNIAYAWEVMQEFQPELMVINTTGLDICHSDFSAYVQNVHKADYGIGWLWNQIQNHPNLQDDTIFVCIPEHGRNSVPNSIVDSNGLFAYDHTNDQNSREVFMLIAGPSSVVNQNLVMDENSNYPGGKIPQTIDAVKSIAHILGFNDSIPSKYLDGRVLTEAFV